jgi:hypothetical protein
MHSTLIIVSRSSIRVIECMRSWRSVYLRTYGTAAQLAGEPMLRRATRWCEEPIEEFRNEPRNKWCGVDRALPNAISVDTHVLPFAMHLCMEPSQSRLISDSPFRRGQARACHRLIARNFARRVEGSAQVRLCATSFFSRYVGRNFAPRAFFKTVPHELGKESSSVGIGSWDRIDSRPSNVNLLKI